MVSGGPKWVQFTTAALRCSFKAGMLLRVFPVEVHGFEHVRTLPEDKGVIFAGNHVWWSDPTYLSGVLPYQPLFIATLRSFSSPRWGLYMCYAGHFPVESGVVWLNARSVLQACSALRQGKRLAVFPEASYRITTTGPLRPFQEGVVKMALMTGSVIVPFGLVGTREVLPWYEADAFPPRLAKLVKRPGLGFLRWLKWMPRRRAVKVAFGPPISTEGLRDTAANRRALNLRLMEVVSELSGVPLPEEMPASA